MKNKIKSIIFDLDDTLYREMDFVEGAFKEVCIYLFQKFNISYDKLYNDTISILNEYGRGKIFNLLCDKYNIDEDIHKLVDVYRNAMPSLKLYDDAIYFLKRYGNKYKLGIITDGKASVQWSKIKSLGIEKYFDKIIVTDDYGKNFWKPGTFAYEKMMKYFKFTADECAYVGDNPHKDFIGARKVGMKTVRIIRKSGDHMSTFLDKYHEADYSINTLKELESIILKIEGDFT